MCNLDHLSPLGSSTNTHLSTLSHTLSQGCCVIKHNILWYEQEKTQCKSVTCIGSRSFCYKTDHTQIYLNMSILKMRPYRINVCWSCCPGGWMEERVTVTIELRGWQGGIWTTGAGAVILLDHVTDDTQINHHLRAKDRRETEEHDSDHAKSSEHTLVGRFVCFHHDNFTFLPQLNQTKKWAQYLVIALVYHFLSGRDKS